MQFAISAITLYLGYKMISQRMGGQPANLPALARHEPLRPQTRRPRVKTAPRVHLAPQEIPTAPPQEALIQPQVSAPPTVKLPKFVSLPVVSETKVAELTELPELEFQLSILTNCDQLRLNGNRLEFKTDDAAGWQTIAGLRIKQRHVEFAWTKSAAGEAESELRNSVLILTGAGQRHVMALRAPQAVPAPNLDLKNSVFRLSSVKDHPPDPRHVRFDLAEAAAWPNYHREGDELSGMGIGSSAVLRYTIAEGSATEVRVVPVGNIVAARLDTRYVLPSGDVEPLSISRGNRKRDHLLDLLDEAEAAPAELSELRSVASRCRHEIRLAENADTWMYVNGIHIQDPVRVAAVNQAISQASAKLNTVISRGRYLEDLLANAPAIREDVRIMEKIVQLSRELRDQKVRYRFYALVGGEQVDLVLAE